MDSPADEDEVRAFVAAAAGRPTFAVLSPGAQRETPTTQRAEELGLKIGTFPTALLSPVAAAIKAGLTALKQGEAETVTALSNAEFRATMGYGDYEEQARRLATEAAAG
jgi:2-methylisocitrate lyase-like PEP mutase family enzyme